MSSAFNPAAVTITLKNWLLGICHAVDSSSDVTTVKLDSIGTAKPTTNLFLYQVEANPGYASFDLPARRSDGSLATKPLIAINLSYLVSFSASSELAANVLMGAVVRAIHAHPGLSRNQITTAVATDTSLSTATLADQKEAIKLSMPPISLDELSKIWGMFSGSKYSLSIHLQVTTIILESDFDPEPALPVRRFTPSVIPNLGPAIEAISIKGGKPIDPIETGATLVLQGHDLQQAGLKIRLDTGDELTPTSSTEVPGAIEVVLPATVPAGLRQLCTEIPSNAHTLSSATVPFILRPKLNSATVKPGKKVELKFDPIIGVSQNAQAIFSLTTGGIADQHSIDLPSAGRPFSKATVDCSTFPAGKYIVRLRVDGAESLLAFFDVAPTVRPEVTL